MIESTRHTGAVAVAVAVSVSVSRLACSSSSPRLHDPRGPRDWEPAPVFELCVRQLAPSPSLINGAEHSLPLTHMALNNNGSPQAWKKRQVRQRRPRSDHPNRPAPSHSLAVQTFIKLRTLAPGPPFVRIRTILRLDERIRLPLSISTKPKVPSNLLSSRFRNLPALPRGLPRGSP
jgi:hypothetical protein